MTIKDIAKESGYAVGTVSRVLNHRPGVSEAARLAIMEVVDKYHFQINSNAQNLKKQSYDGIAIIIKGTKNMLFAAIVEELQRLIKVKNYDCVVYYIGEYDNEVEQAIQICVERRPLGILFLGSCLSNFQERFKEIDIPCVLVTNSAERLGFDNLSSVSTDDVKAAKYAVEYLISLGHKNIGMLGGRMEVSLAGNSRYIGCLQAFQEHGMVFHYDLQYEATTFSIEEGYRSMNRLLDKMPNVTAVFTVADVMAIGAIRAIKDRGLRVPEDISVIGFDGIDIGDYMIPRLTTIRQQRECIVAKSIEVLLNCIEQGAKARHIIAEFHLISGESVCQYNK